MTLKGFLLLILVIFVKNDKKDVISDHKWRHMSEMTRDMTILFQNVQNIKGTRGIIFPILV